MFNLSRAAKVFAESSAGSGSKSAVKLTPAAVGFKLTPGAVGFKLTPGLGVVRDEVVPGSTEMSSIG
jgi:hypothetical protein